jgi:hypothetical protein
VAARVAFEESVVVGRLLCKRSIGSYHYSKQLPRNWGRLCHVAVFRVLLDHQLNDRRYWEEKEQGERQRVTPRRVAHMVDEVGLTEIIRSAFPMLGFASTKAGNRRRLPRQSSWTDLSACAAIRPHKPAVTVS